MFPISIGVLFYTIELDTGVIDKKYSRFQWWADKKQVIIQK